MISLTNKSMVGAYNNITIFNLEIVVDGKRKVLTAERDSNDKKWNITEKSDFLNEEYKKKILDELNSEFKVIVGECILNNSLNTKGYVLELKNNIALIKTENEYIIASGISKSNGKVDWIQGRYFNNLLEASMVFNEKTNTVAEQVQNLKNALNQINHFTYFSSIVENETENEKEKITEYDIKKLDKLYDEYISNDDCTLLSKGIMDRENELNFESIKENVVDYLKEMKIDITKVSNEEIADMVDDVLDYSVENNEEPSSLIWNQEYLEGIVDELSENEEEDEL